METLNNTTTEKTNNPIEEKKKAINEIVNNLDFYMLNQVHRFLVNITR